MPDGLKRLHHSGQAHFITFSCYHRLPLLSQMHMEDEFLCALEEVRRRFNLRLRLCRHAGTRSLADKRANRRFTSKVGWTLEDEGLDSCAEAGTADRWRYALLAGQILRPQRAQSCRLPDSASLYSSEPGQAGLVPLAGIVAVVELPCLGPGRGRVGRSGVRDGSGAARDRASYAVGVARVG